MALKTLVDEWEPKPAFIDLIISSNYDPDIIVMEFRLFHSESRTLSGDWDSLFSRFFQRYKSRSITPVNIHSSWYPSGIALEQFIARGVDVNSNRFKGAALSFRMYNREINSSSTNWDALFLKNYEGFIDEVK